MQHIRVVQNPKRSTYTNEPSEFEMYPILQYNQIHIKSYLPWQKWSLKSRAQNPATFKHFHIICNWIGDDIRVNCPAFYTLLPYIFRRPYRMK